MLEPFVAMYGCLNNIFGAFFCGLFANAVLWSQIESPHHFSVIVVGKILMGVRDICGQSNTLVGCRRQPSCFAPVCNDDGCWHLW